MRWLLAIVILCTGTAVRGDSRPTALVGKVVKVEDGSTLWVYLEHAQASYRISLSGIVAPPIDQPDGEAMRRELAQRVLGRVVTVMARGLTEEGPIPAEVFLNGYSVNRELARGLLAATHSGSMAPAIPTRLFPGIRAGSPESGTSPVLRLVRWPGRIVQLIAVSTIGRCCVRSRPGFLELGAVDGSIPPPGLLVENVTPSRGR